MISNGLEKLAELVADQYRAIYKDAAAPDALRNTCESIDAFGNACRDLLGLQLDWVLHSILSFIGEQLFQIYQSIDFTRSAPENTLKSAQALCDAAKLVHKIQIQQNCSLASKSESMIDRIIYYNTHIRRKLNPEGRTKGPPDSAANPNQRNLDREIYIYHARKDAKRSFADIGRELGISAGRVSQIYKRIDYALNGDEADHHQPTYPKRDIIVDGARIKRRQGEKKSIEAGRIIPFPEKK